MPEPVAWRVCRAMAGRVEHAGRALTRVLGIDPGSRVTGYGVIEHDGRTLRYVTSGCVRVGEARLADRLCMIHDGIRAVVAEYRPDEAAVEKVFVNRNVSSALKLGQARGAAIVGAGHGGLPVFEYAPNEIKLAVVGTGHAAKEQVQHMVRVLLGLSGELPADAADALAAAICHGYREQGAARVPGARRARGGRWI